MKKIVLLFALNSLIFNALDAQIQMPPVKPGDPMTKADLPGPAMLKRAVDQKADAIEAAVIAWRRDFHEHPELSNREFKTAEKVAAHLKKLGLEVRTGVGKTGVVGILKGGKPGGVVALRADMDGLPVVERNDLPFKSEVKDQYLGQEVGVMHACGHDTHTAMLMGAAEILTGLKADIPGTIVFLFQPAEEGPPPGEEGGAPLMMKEGVLDNPKVEAIFGIHINSMTPVGVIKYKPQGTMAAADRFTIKVSGKGSHGSTPWHGADPILCSAAIIQGIQNIISRQTELTNEAAVITVGKITAGTRHNIIPETAEMIGTIRTLDPKMREKLIADFHRTVTNLAEANGCTAELILEPGIPINYNDPELTRQMLPTLEAVAGGENNVLLTKASTGAEDFAFYAQKIPGFFVFLGGMEKGKVAVEVGAHHTPDFQIDESGMKLGVRTHCYLALDWLAKRPVSLK